MTLAKHGDKVRIDLVGTLDDGTVFQSTLINNDCDDDTCHADHGDDEDCGCATGPLDIRVGAGDVFPQIEEMLVGMTPGETRRVTISAADAFGEYDEDNVVTILRTQLPADLNPQQGEELVLTGDDGEHFEVTVVETSPDDVTFDANHPLAGEDLTFEITLREIV